MISELLVKKAVKVAVSALEENLPDLKAKVKAMLEASDTPFVEGELEASLDETLGLVADKALDQLLALVKELTSKE